MATDAFSLYGELEFDTSDFIDGLESAMDAMKDFQNDMENFSSTVESDNEAMGDSSEKASEKGSKGLKSWGIDLEKFSSKGKGILNDFGLDVDKLASKFGMNGALLAGIVACTTALAKLGAEMDEARSEIVKGTGAIGKALDDLERSSNKALVKGVGVSVKETGKLIADLNTRFGLTGKTLEDVTVDFGHFAKVTGVDINNAVNDVADVMKRWNVPLNKSKDLMNQFTKASQLSGASVDELMSAVKQGQVYFSQFGYNLTESVALLASFRKNGIQTDTVITGMRTALAKFASEGKNAGEAFKEITKQIQETENETEAMSLAVETFGTRAGPEMFNAIRNGMVDLDDFTEELRNAGTAMEDTWENARTSKDAMEDLKNALKGTFGGLGQAVTSVIKNIVDSITELVRFIEPIITPIVNVIRTIITKIADLIGWLVKEIRRSIEENSIALKGAITVLNDFGKAFNSIFGDLIDIVKHTFGLIFSLIGGRWEEAWVNAQLIFWKFARVVSEICTLVANLFAKLVNFISEKVMGKFGDFFKDMYKKLIDFSHKTGNIIDPTGLGGLTKNMSETQIDKLLDSMFTDLAQGKAMEVQDFAESWGLNDRIKELENKLDELKGVTTEIKDLGTSFTGATFDIGSLGMTEESQAESKEWLQKRLQQQLDAITEMKKAELERLRDEGATQEQLNQVNEMFAKRQIEIYTQLQDMKKEADLESVKNYKNAEEEKLLLLEYYENEQSKYEIEVRTNTITAIEQMTEDMLRKRAELEAKWTQKIEEQRINLINNEEKILLQFAQTQKEKDEIALEYSRKKYEIEKSRLELEKQTALEEVKDFPELMKQVEEYYGTELKMIETNMNAQELDFKNKYEGLAKATGWWKKFSDSAKKAIDKVKKAFGTIKDVIKKVMESAIKIVKSTFSGFVNIFSKLFEFDNDEMLNSLLAWEDKILTFFVEGASKIPAFIESALQSIRVLTENILGVLSDEGIKEGIQNIVKTIVRELPMIINNVLDILDIIFNSVVDAISENADEIISIIVKLVKNIIKKLPKILPVIVKGIIALVEGILDALEALLDDDEAMEEFTDMLAHLIQQIVESMIKNLPRVIKMIFQLIVALVKTIIKAIVSIIRDTDWGAIWSEIKRVFGQIWDKIVEWWSNIWSNVKNFFEAIGNWFKGVFESIGNWFKDFFSAIGNWFKGAWEGIQNFFSAIGQWFADIWDTIVGWVEKIGDKMGEFFGLFSRDNKSTGGHVAKGILGALTGGISWLFTGFADGTENAPKGLAMVGEEGPELVNFRGGEQVIPAPQTKQILQSGTNGSVFNVNFYETRDTTAYAMMRQLKGWQKDLAFNAVL